jgi:hypothetical protein
VTNVVTLVFAFGVLLVPGIARAAWSTRDRPEVRAFVGLLAVVFAVESLVFTLHSTHGSYFHSLAAFFPFGVALGVEGIAALLRSVEGRRLAGAAAIMGALIVSVFAVSQWDISFNVPYRERVAIVDRIPAGSFMAIDAAAWRWIAGRPAYVTPSSGLDPCTLGSTRVTSIVLEPAHFSVYDALYAGGPHADYIGDPIRVGDVEIFAVNADAAGSLCSSTR